MPFPTGIAGVLAVLTWALPATVPAQGRATIKIATQSPLSSDRAGDRAVQGEAIKLGAQLAIEQLKTPLERMGFRVELMALDDQDRPHVGVSNAKNVVVDRDVLAVIGHLSSGVAIPASEVYKDVALAMVSPAGTSPLVTDRGLLNVSRVCGRDDVQGEVGAEFAASTVKARSVYVVHDRTPYGQLVAEAFKADAERRGIRVVGFEGTEERSSFDPVIAPIKAKGPDLIYFAGRYDQAAPFFVQARERGVTAKLLGPDGLDSSDLTRIAGKAVVGLQLTSVASPMATLPKAKPFVDDFRRRFGGDPGPHAAEAYDATAVALKAIETAAAGGRAPSRGEVSAAVRKVKLQGITGDIEFDGRGDRKKAPYFVLQVASEDPAKWDQNRVVRQVTTGPPAKR
jgi:branched-chain amino acid transport system substrate-binding protein